jgi:hypothetical protein
MQNIFIYEGHSSQNIYENSGLINTGDELFNKTRINVPDGFRFITFHFNDMPTTANFTGPFILYGMKEITEEDIETLFYDEDENCELNVGTNNLFSDRVLHFGINDKIICENVRDKNIKMFKRKMFKSFVVNYINFISDIAYPSTKTYEFSRYKFKNINFKNYENIKIYISKIVEEKFEEICNIYKINLEDYKIIGNIDKNDIVNVLGDQKYDLLQNIDKKILFNLLPEEHKTNFKKQIKQELNIQSDINIKEYCKGKKCNNELLKEYDELLKEYDELLKEHKEITNIIQKKKNKQKLEKLKIRIIYDYIDNNITEFLTKDNIFNYIKNQKIDLFYFQNYIPFETILKQKLREYYGFSGDKFIYLFLSHFESNNQTSKEIIFDKEIIKNIMKKKIINIIINIVCLNNKIIDEYKRMENIKNIIMNNELIDEFFYNFFVLLLNKKNIETIKYDNVNELLNYFYLNNIIYNIEERQILQKKAWGDEGKEIRLRPMKLLKDSIEKFNQNTIDRICNYFKFNIRSYKSNTLTPILSFTDVLSFCRNENGIKCKEEEEGNQNVKWETFKYGFFPFDEYIKLPELCHDIYDTNIPEIERNINTGLSKYSYDKKLPSKLFFYEDKYYFENDEDYKLIIYYFRIFCNLFNFDDYDLDSILYLNIDNYKEIIPYLSDKINKSDKSTIPQNIDELKEIIQKINVYFNFGISEENIEDIEYEHNIEKKTNYENFLLYFLCLYRIFQYIEINSTLTTYIYYMKELITFYDKVNINFFNRLPKGTYIITSCGSFTKKLTEKYELLDKNPVKILKEDTDIEKEHKKKIIDNETKEQKQLREQLKIEQTRFNQRTTEYDTYWRKKYLKYKQKYLYLKTKYNL